MATSPSLSLNVGPGKVTYKLHPVVVFSILDHYKRRNTGQNRVVGTLLGERKANNVVYIKNCFPVPHVENEDQVAVDMEFHTRMQALHARVCPSEVVVGWYSTGAKISYISSLMHDVYKNEVQKTQGEEPVHLTVDVDCNNLRMACEAYIGTTIKVGGKGVMARFEPAKLQLHAYEAERIGVDALINGQPDDSKLDAPATILTDLDNLELSMNKLLDLLEGVSSYVDKVQAGEIKGDPEVGRAIASALAAIPHVDKSTFGKMFTDNMQDLLMIVYLANLTRTQVSLADKINALLT